MKHNLQKKIKFILSSVLRSYWREIRRYRSLEIQRKKVQKEKENQRLYYRRYFEHGDFENADIVSAYIQELDQYLDYLKKDEIACIEIIRASELHFQAGLQRHNLRKSDIVKMKS